MTKTKIKEFHEQLASEINELESWHRKVTVESKQKAKQIKIEHKLKYKLHDYNFKKFFVNIINDSRVNYQLDTFIRKYMDVERNLSMLHGFAPALLELHEKCKRETVSRDFHYYVFLKFYASNYETLFSMLIPACKSSISLKKNLKQRKET